MMARTPAHITCLIFLSLWIGVSLHSVPLLGQVNEIQVVENYEGRRCSDFLQQLEQQYPVRFFFIPDWIEDIRVRQDKTPMALTALLDSTIQGSGLTYVILNNYIYLSKGNTISENTPLVLTPPSPIVRNPEPQVIRFSPTLPVRSANLSPEAPPIAQQVLAIGNP